MGFGGVNGAISISKCCKLLVVVIKFTNASGLYISQNTFSMGPFKYYFSMFFAHVSIWPPPPTHLFSIRQQLATPTHPPLCWHNTWMAPIQKPRNDNGQSVSFFFLQNLGCISKFNSRFFSDGLLLCLNLVIIHCLNYIVSAYYVKQFQLWSFQIRLRKRVLLTQQLYDKNKQDTSIQFSNWPKHFLIFHLQTGFSLNFCIELIQKYVKVQSKTMGKFQSLWYVIKMCNMYTKSLVNVAFSSGKKSWKLWNSRKTNPR